MSGSVNRKRPLRENGHRQLLADAGIDSYGRDLDGTRRYWFDHPAMLTTEFRVHPNASALVGMRRETGTD
jgi:hypothetical protein